MKIVLSLALLTFSLVALAHPAGNYIINGDKEVILTIKRIGKCPLIADAMMGTIRSFEFNKKAEAHPYKLISGYYVEIHEGSKEVYVQVNDSCIPKMRGERYEASHETFHLYSLERTN